MKDRLRKARSLLAAAVVVAATASAGEIVRVGIYDNLPKVGLSPEGKPQGIFVDIIEAIAAAEGWTLEFVPGTWAEGLDRLEAGVIDLMPDVAPTPARETLYAFHAEPALSDWFQVYAPRGSRIRSVLDLDGRRVAVLERSIQREAFASMAGGFGLDVVVREFPDYQAAFASVARGDADAVVTNRFFGAAHAGAWGLEDTAIIFHPGGLFFAAPRDADRAVLDAIDRHLVELKRQPGSAYYAALRRWITEPVQTVVPPWVKRAAGAGAVVVALAIALTVAFRRRASVRERQLRVVNGQRRRAERALGESEAKYRTLFETAGDAILLMRHECFFDCNETALRLFGCGREALIGAHPGEFSPPLQPDGRGSPEKAHEMIEAALTHGLQRFEWVHRRADGTTFFAEVALTPLTLGGETVLQAIVRDITERKRAEEEVRALAESLERRVAERTAELAVARDRAEAADRLKSAFLATMSHELRTPLNSIIGFTGILLQELAGPLTEEQRTQLGIVRGSGRHLLALVNDVLDISKIEAGQLEVASEPFGLDGSLERVVAIARPLAERKGLDLRFECAGRIGMMVGDQRRVEQVLLNLLTNAVKFTDHGSVSLEASVEGEAVRIAVADTGIGIEPQDLPALFQPFRQIDTGLARCHEGTGLGLAISKRLVEMMGGTIEVTSRPGEGSVFTVRLPLNRPRDERRPRASGVGTEEGS